MGTLARLPKGFVPATTTLYDTVVQRVREAGWAAITRKGDSVADIAARAGIGERTVERFIWGDTARPWAQTVFGIAEALGFTAGNLLSEEPMRARI